MTFRQSEGVIIIDGIGYTEESIQQHFDVELPTNWRRSYNIIAPNVEEQCDGKTAFPQEAPTLPYADIANSLAMFTPINPPAPEPPEVDPIEHARQEAIAVARAAVATAGIVVVYGVTTEGEPTSVRLWARSEADYTNYGVLAGQLREADDYSFTDRAYRIRTMDGGMDFPNRAALRYVLARYMETAQQLYESII